MNDYNKRYIIEKVGDHRMRRDSRDMRDVGDESDFEDERDYEDSRRGIRGSGRGRSRGRGRDMRDYEDDYDYDKPLKLTKQEMLNWKRNMENADGSKGEHFDMQQILHVADKLGARFEDYSEKQLCLATNMFYSDYCKTFAKYVSTDKMLNLCVELALDYFEDPDGVEPTEKLAVQYHCMTTLA
jgi:hypothetical protein